METNPINPPLPDRVMEQVDAWKRELVWRVRAIGLSVEPDRVIHLIEDDKIYVMANPVVSREEMYDDFGQPTGDYVEIRNFHSIYQPTIRVPGNSAPDEVKKLYASWHLPLPPSVVIPNPQPIKIGPILLPQLIVKLSTDGELLVDGAGPH